jgi:hypothetical protein
MPVIRANQLTRLSTIGIVVAIGLTGCGSSSTPKASQGASASPTPLVTQAPEDLVTRAGLVNGDLAGGQTVRLMDGGDQVDGQVTLDNCGFDFTTEAHRLARRQVLVLAANGRKTGQSNEVVAYDSQGQAALALSQFRASVTRCPKHAFEASTVAGVPDLRYDVSKIATDAALPVKDNVVATIEVTPKGSNQHLYGVLIFQLRGTVLDGVYLLSDTKPTPRALAALRALATRTGRKLAAV